MIWCSVYLPITDKCPMLENQILSVFPTSTSKRGFFFSDSFWSVLFRLTLKDRQTQGWNFLKIHQSFFKKTLLLGFGSTLWPPIFFRVFLKPNQFLHSWRRICFRVSRKISLNYYWSIQNVISWRWVSIFWQRPWPSFLRILCFCESFIFKNEMLDC